MQPWQIKALELETSALKSLDRFIHEHALYFLIGVIYLLLALLVWILSGALRRKGRESLSNLRPAIFIDLTGSPTAASGTTVWTRSCRIGNHCIAIVTIIIPFDTGQADGGGGTSRHQLAAPPVAQLLNHNC